jgi:hypothetical protein
MNKSDLFRFTSLGVAFACLTSAAKAASTAVNNNTFQLQSRSTMVGIATGGPQGWASSRYDHHGNLTNQLLQINCRGLASNQVYHLMASWGTNGALVHLSDFTPIRSGAILINYQAGSPNHFIGTTNPSPTAYWSNHMSWVLFPGAGTNWCYPMHPGSHLPSMMTSGIGGDMGSGMMGGGGTATNSIGPTPTTGGNDTTGQHDQYGGMGGGMGSGDGWGCGWPAMTNWWSATTTNWWPVMDGWCWSYTNLWTPGSQYRGDWWCHFGRSANHRMPFPDSLNSVPTINGLLITDANLQPVLTADLANPQSFTYNTRCAFRNQGFVTNAAATLRASATQRSTHFALSATGLTPGTTYFVEINGANATPVATDRYGRLNIPALPGGMTSMRGISSISILDRSYNSILRATLPPD